MESLAQSAEWRPESSNSQGDCVAHPLPGEVASFTLGKYVLGECVTPWVLKFLDPLLGACPQRYRGLLSAVFAACSSPSAALSRAGEGCLVHSGSGWGRCQALCMFVPLDMCVCPNVKSDFISPFLLQQDLSDGFWLGKPKTSWFFYERWSRHSRVLLWFEVTFMWEALQMCFDGNTCSFQCQIPVRDFVLLNA